MFDYNDNNHKYAIGYTAGGPVADQTAGISKGTNQPIAYPMPEV
jgi:hypothetical protein